MNPNSNPTHLLEKEPATATGQARSRGFEQTLLSARRTMLMSEILKIALDSFKASKTRFALTALGMVIGTASVILVVTIGLTGKQYVLDLIQKIGTNTVELEYAGGGATPAERVLYNDYLTRLDERAVDQQVPGVMYSSPVLSMHDPISFGGGVVHDTLVLGVSPDYRHIRNLLVTVGRFFDQTDDDAHIKCAVVTEPFAKERYGSDDAAVGQSFQIQGIPFTIIGVFKEAVNDFGQSEIEDQTVLIPYSVARYFTGTEQRESDLFFHAQHERRSRCRQGDQAHDTRAAPAQLCLQCADADRVVDHGGRNSRRADRRAGAGGSGHAGRGRRGHHEHHAGQRALPASAKSAFARRWAPPTARSSCSFWPRPSSSRSPAELWALLSACCCRSPFDFFTDYSLPFSWWSVLIALTAAIAGGRHLRHRSRHARRANGSGGGAEV